MNHNDLEKLEFYEILERLGKFCHTYIGKSKALSLLPSTSQDKVKSLLAETEEAIILIARNSAPSFYEIADVTMELKSLESNGTLSPKSILNLAQIFKLSQELKDYFNKDFLDVQDFPILDSLFSTLYTNKDVLNKVLSCILDENTIDDNASKTLQSIRRKSRKLEQDIRSKLSSMIHSSNYSKYIQENVVTIRNDRFVIPVKEEYRSQIKGFIHDVSNAGSTVFIEPISVFEMNNELSRLKIDEEIEIEKILQELSSLFYPYVDELTADIETIGTLDFIFAKASYAKFLKANIPTVNFSKELHLKNARHPLIEKEKVVPISVDLGKDFSVLLITGPNTGGKTVSLKTVGLLVCMACSGLAIPADEVSTIPVFDHIFADIGDDQSISDSLSTFSSHMLNIVKIIEHATENSLILVDELGSGTDPLEGANLAISILDYFYSKHALIIATTHYQELKQYALVTDGFENASVEFDLATLSPTYHLLVGIPGKSNAFEISRKLGLKEEIIKKAESFLSNDQIDIEQLLKNIYDDKSVIEKEKQEIDEKLKEVEILKNSLVHDNKALQQQEQEIINKAKIEARNILLEAKEEASEILKQMEQSTNNKELNNLRNTLNKKIKEIQITPTSSNNNISSLARDEIQLNKEVYVSSLGQNGIVVSHISKSDEVQVQIGNMKLNVPINALKNAHKERNQKQKNSVFSGYTSISKSRTVKTEINVIGQNVEDAIFVVDKFLDDAALSKLQTVRIVHGKGTGKLRDGIHQFLKKNPHVKSFRMGTYGEGEMGVTVVELK